MKSKVAFFGSSTLAGKGQAFNIIAQIEKSHPEMEFFNFGVGGIKTLAMEEKTRYLPFYETMYAILQGDPGRSYDQFNLLSMYRDAFRTLVLRWTPDQVAIKNGWRYHSDGIHLNGKGAAIFIDLVEGYLKESRK